MPCAARGRSLLSTIQRPRRDNEPFVLRRSAYAVKYGLRSLFPAPAAGRRVLLVLGSQRSGTTMLQQSLLDRSWRILILEEHDRRLVRPGDPERVRWDELDRVRSRIAPLPSELVVAKPLVESHRARELLTSLPNAVGIWMLRHYLAVATSNLRRFGMDNGIRDLQTLVDQGAANWRGGCGEAARQEVARLLESNLSQLDAAALFWWSRNRIYLDQHLGAEPRIRVMRYEDLLSRPGESVEALSGFLGLPLPADAMVRRVRPPGTASGQLRPDIDKMCRDLLDEFDTAPSLPDSGVPDRPAGR